MKYGSRIFSNINYLRNQSYQINPIQKLQLKICSLLFWNVLEKILDQKNESPFDGALMEPKTGGMPCNFDEHFIGNQDLLYVKAN